jgi:hypothetical protein
LALTLGTKDFEAILFNQSDPLPPHIRAAYAPDVHHYQGLVSLQLVVEHWEPAEPPLSFSRN